MHEKWLKTLLEKRILTFLDVHFAQFLLTKSGEKSPNPLLFFLICWLSARTRQGNVCVDLRDFTLHSFLNEYPQESELMIEISVQLGEIDTEQCIALLKIGAFVGDAFTPAPLILNGHLLYLQRMWHDEQILADYFFTQSKRSLSFSDANKAQIKSLLAQYFSAPKTDEIDWQQVAVVIALFHQFAIISGGPGTGKTTTIAKLLCILSHYYQTHLQKPLRIALAAPTGKAAARLSESLESALQQFPLDDETRAHLPKEAATLHRLLGVKAGSQSFRYHKNNLLPVDLLIIDEASMLDISMMARVIDALSPTTRLILLGDHQQLSSVEAGSILGELCRFADYGYSQICCDVLTELLDYHVPASANALPLSDAICLLRKSYRFNAKSGIGLLAQAVNQQDLQSVNKILQSDFPDLDIDFTAAHQCDPIITRCVAFYRDYLQQLAHLSVDAALEKLTDFQLIAVVRKGKFGVEALNKKIEKKLKQLGLIHFNADSRWFAGQPIIIRQNHYELNLFNGDVGMVLPEKETGRLRVYFKQINGEIKSIAPSRLPEHEMAFAITVHQSQGSEFSTVFLVLPDKPTALLTKELIYTAITRAKKNVILSAERTLLMNAINIKTKRVSGLEQQLLTRFLSKSEEV